VTPFFLERNPVFETTFSRPNAATVHRQADARFRVNSSAASFPRRVGPFMQVHGAQVVKTMQSRDREAVADNALDTSGVNSQRCVSALSFPGSTVEYIFAPKAQTCAGSRSLLYVLF
jgi:4-hydroxyphenylpyruvate dioxygenase-like putative hemolysin